jgi:F-type H+-transporting ATPase subunit a
VVVDLATSAVLASEGVAPDGGGCHLGSGCGFPAPNGDIFFFDPYVTLTVLGVDFHINKAVVLMALGSVIIVTFFLVAFRRPKIVPGKTQLVGEVGYLFVRDGIAREVIGEEGDRFVPFLTSMFFFVWVMNFMGVLPFAQFPVMSRVMFPAGLALIVYVLYMYLGMKHQGVWGFFRNAMFPPGLPVFVYVLLAPIELLGVLIVRPFTQAIRLFANMFAGHLLLVTFSVGTWYLLSPSVIGILGSAASFTTVVALTGFEMFIQGLQAFIFTLLTAVYISGSLHAEH